MAWHARQHSAVSYAKTVKPIKIPFVLCTRVGRSMGLMAPLGEYH